MRVASYIRLVLNTLYPDVVGESGRAATGGLYVGVALGQPGQALI